MKPLPIPFFIVLLCAPAMAGELPKWIDATEVSGLGQQAISRLKFADLNSDRRPDIIIQPETADGAVPLVYLQTGQTAPSDPPAFVRKPDTNLPHLQRGDVLIFADLDNDGHLDAVLGRYLDLYQETYTPPPFEPTRSAWMKGTGDGSFGAPRVLEAAQLATTRAIAVGDVNQDGLPDLFIGNWYERYFTGFEAFANDLLLQVTRPEGDPAFVRWPMPDETRPTGYETDLGGRPTYGVALPRLDEGLPMLLELNYGRRWNRLYRMQERLPMRVPNRDQEAPAPMVPMDARALPAHLVRSLKGEDIAVKAGVDGDAIRHGRHPVWPSSHAEAQPRSLRPDEAPFRANGNTFDSAVGDIDNDGDFDLFFSTIIHAWAGESSDRSRFLVNQLQETGRLEFLSFAHLSVDRIPALPEPGEPLTAEVTQYNQGDISAELADLNHDGRLDLILCSSDYPDPPPHDERLRLYFQQADGRFRDVTASLGIDHVGAGMVSVADVDGDGDLDILIGQSFNRLPAALRRQAALASGALPPGAPEDAPARTRARLFLNTSPPERSSILIDLVGDPASGVTRQAHGTVVRLSADLDGDPSTPEVTQMRQVLGPSGHAGKQHPLTVHFGLGQAQEARLIEVAWPGQAEPVRLESVAPGRYRLEQGGNLISLNPLY